MTATEFESVFKHKYKHSFQYSLNPFCNFVSGQTESSSHCLLHCSEYSEERWNFLNNYRQININILENKVNAITRIFLFGDASINDHKNTSILDSTLNTYPRPKDFHEPLFMSHSIIKSLFNMQNIFWIWNHILEYDTRIRF